MNSVQPAFHGDRPIERAAEDRLGFGVSAQHVADAIGRMVSPDGFVIAIEGDWGSGKTSFINLVCNALRQADNSPEIVRFLPWMISSRDGLLKELFAEIARCAIRIEPSGSRPGGFAKFFRKVWPDRHSVKRSRKKKMERVFSGLLSRLVDAGKLAELFGFLGFGPAAEAGKRSFDEWVGDGSLDSNKAKITEELRGISRKIVVFVDDLDRLEPNELIELFRLIRAVVDFPNVIFVVCYSRKIVASNLAAALSIENGEEYLEKIVQISFSVPRPEAFDLRRMLRQEMQLVYADLLSGDGPRSRSVRDRLAYVIDDEGGRALRTPRHVIRAVNAIRFHAAPVLESIDISDMAWLQLVRLQSPKLYGWIETYLIDYAAKQAGARVGEEAKAADTSKLTSIIDEIEAQGSSRASIIQALSANLPGVSYDFERVDERHRMVLSIFGDEELLPYVRDARLGSPHHFRYYFALTVPENSISEKEFADFLDSAHESPDRAKAHFDRLASTVLPGGRLACQPLMDRLVGSGVDTIPVGSLRAILLAVAENMDAAALRTGQGDWGEYWVWRDAESLMRSIWPRFGGPDRSALAQELFSMSSSLCWLTDIFRREIFAHGIYGDRPEPEGERLFSRQELDVAAAELLRRYRVIRPADLPRLPRIAPILYAWWQFDPGALPEIRSKIQFLSESDEGFVTLLNGMRGWRATNGLISNPLVESRLGPFFSIEEMKRRLSLLSERNGGELAVQARRLLSDYRAGEGG